MSGQDRLRRWHIISGNPADTRDVALVLPLTLLTIVITPFLGGSRAGVLASIVLIGGSALFTLNRSGVRPSIRRPASVVVALAVFTATVTSSVVGGSLRSTDAGERWLNVVALISFALVLMFTPALMILRLLMRPKITIDTVAGALAAYLQVGIFFTVLYRLVDWAGGGHFFAQGDQPLGAFQYFSFITLTTVGYGDLTPATSTGQLLASLEALTGQLFLVSVVALVVGNLGRDIPRHRSSDYRGDVVDDDDAG
jgi:hypothetical protein